MKSQNRKWMKGVVVLFGMVLFSCLLVTGFTPKPNMNIVEANVEAVESYGSLPEANIVVSPFSGDSSFQNYGPMSDTGPPEIEVMYELPSTFASGEHVAIMINGEVRYSFLYCLRDKGEGSTNLPQECLGNNKKLLIFDSHVVNSDGLDPVARVHLLRGRPEFFAFDCTPLGFTLIKESSSGDFIVKVDLARLEDLEEHTKEWCSSQPQG